MSRLASVLASIVALLLAAGCQSYRIVQTNIFSDDDGRLVSVEYGESESEHVNTFIAPTNGKELEFRSHLMVRVHLPDGDSFKAWQCMNFLVRGTMYKTDNEKWMCLADGFSFLVFRQTERDKTKYAEVYRGVICDAPQTDDGIKTDSKWRKLKKNGNGEWK